MVVAAQLIRYPRTTNITFPLTTHQCLEEPGRVNGTLERKGEGAKKNLLL